MAAKDGAGAQARDPGAAAAERIQAGASAGSLDLDGQEMALLYEMVKAANIPGSVAEIYLRLATKVNAAYYASTSRRG